MDNICRILLTDEEVEHFVTGILEIRDTRQKRKAINQITAAERNISTYDNYQTLLHRENRDFEWRDEQKRELLRSQIIEELFTLMRLDDDDKIKLGRGGALPKTQVKSEKKTDLYYWPSSCWKIWNCFKNC